MEFVAYSGLVVMGAAAYGGYKSLKVPVELKDVPEVPLVNMLASFVRGEPFDVRFNQLVKPVLEKEGIARMFTNGEWMLVLGDPKHVREVLAENDRFLKRREIDPKTDLRLFTKILGWSNILFADGEDWRRHRRVANPAFKKAWSPATFSACVDDAVEKIDTNDGVVMARELFQQLTLDALGKGLFSHDFNALKRGEGSYYLMIYQDIMRDLGNPLYFTFPILEKLVPSRQTSHAKAQEFRIFLKNIIDERRKEILENNEKDDLLTLMIKAAEDQSLSDDDVINDLAVFFLAGHDTTANTLTTAFFYLANHQDIQERARQKVISVLSDNPHPTLEQLKKLEYIDCIIKESMRIITTVPILRRHAPAQETLSSGQVIPKNTTVLLHSWAIHHDPKVYTDPETFNPDRFLDPHSPASTQWMAFGSGSRMCLGMGFSLVEQRVVLALLLLKYTFQPGPKTIGKTSPTVSIGGLVYPLDTDLHFTKRA